MKSLKFEKIVNIDQKLKSKNILINKAHLKGIKGGIVIESAEGI